MSDWWERLFDYDAAREDVRRRSGRSLWHLFEEARQKQPAHPGYLLRHLAADARHWQLDLRYCQGQDAPVYAVSSADLNDERWTLRAWHADRWLRAIQGTFHRLGTSTQRARTCGPATTRRRAAAARPSPATPTCWPS